MRDVDVDYARAFSAIKQQVTGSNLEKQARPHR